MKEKEELYFVGIPDPVSVRREILLSIRSSIKFLKQNESLNELRSSKLEEMMRFKNDLKEINALVNKLKDNLPKAKIRLKKEERNAAVSTKEHKSKSNAKKKVSELERLESELGDIEKKLGRLG